MFLIVKNIVIGIVWVFLGIFLVIISVVLNFLRVLVNDSINLLIILGYVNGIVILKNIFYLLRFNVLVVDNILLLICLKVDFEVLYIIGKDIIIVEIIVVV